MQDDHLPHLRNSLRRSGALQVQNHPAPRVVETFPQAGAGFNQPPRVGLTFWQWCARVIPIVAAIASTSLLAYYLVFDHRSSPFGLARSEDQPRPERSSNADAGREAQSPPGSSPNQQQAQAQTTSAQPQQQPQTQQSPSQTPTQQPIPANLGPRLAMPSDDVLLMLVMSSVTALNHANATGNYSVLHDIGAPAFQNANSPERLSQIFSDRGDVISTSLPFCFSSRSSSVSRR